MVYRPIADYGLIGDCRTAALASKDGSVDWLCLPHFSGDPIFAAILDDEKGGRFQITGKNVKTIRQCYRERTAAVVVTEFECDSGSFRLTDCLVAGTEETAGEFSAGLHTHRPHQRRSCDALRAGKERDHMLAEGLQNLTSVLIWGAVATAAMTTVLEGSRRQLVAGRTAFIFARSVFTGCFLTDLAAVHPRMATGYENITPVRRLEPPGPFGLHYGIKTPLVIVIGQMAYGIVMGIFYPISRSVS
jgi:hypothetical protein